MVEQLKGMGTGEKVDCAADPIASLVEMFVGMVQGKRIPPASVRPCGRSS
jgi:hypothetical protein